MNDSIEWRVIPGLDGFYEASSDGRIRRARPGQRTQVGLVLKSRPNIHGRYQVMLTVKNFRYTKSVHRLVTEAFHGPAPFDKAFACHIDGDKTNNRADNLRWGTNSSNQKDSVRHGTHPQAKKTHCPHGHEYTPENTYSRVRDDGRNHRVCRECYRIAQRAKRTPAYREPEQP